MKISVIEKDNKVSYQIADVEAKYKKVLKDTYYTMVEDRFEKCFPLPFANPDITKSNFIRYAEEMFTDIADAKPFRWEEGLKHFASIAKEARIDWWTNGPASFAVRGMDYPVNDLDFIFYSSDMDAINEAFRDFIIEPIVSTEGTKRSNLVNYYGVGYSFCRTCLMVEPYASSDDPEPVPFGQYASKHLEIVNWNGFDIKVAPLDLHLKMYERWGKIQNVQKIKAFINNK